MPDERVWKSISENQAYLQDVNLNRFNTDFLEICNQGFTPISVTVGYYPLWWFPFFATKCYKAAFVKGRLDA